MLRMCCRGGAGHVSSSFSCVEILVALYYTGIMQTDMKDDRFILSKGQASPILYAILADLGIIDKEMLDGFNKEGGPFAVHLQDTVHGVLASMGSLGMGLGMATGMAYGKKLNRQGGIVFCLVGDAETYEGSIWEAAAFASHNSLNNLVVIMDRNGMGATDFTEDMCSVEPITERWRAFGWDVVRLDGHNIEDLLLSMKDMRSRPSPRPYMIIADTIKGKGISFMEGEPMWHSQVPTKADKEKAILEVCDGHIAE